MTKQETRDLLVRVFGDDEAAAKEAMSFFQKHRYSLSEHGRQAILELLPVTQEIKDDAKQLDILLRLVGMAAFCNRMHEYSGAIEELMWLGLEHKSGVVRQDARRLIDYFPFTRRGEDGGIDSITKQRLDLLQKIEQRIKVYEPQNPPTSIEHAAPSVYKTLVLAWHDITDIPIIQQAIDWQERAIDNDIPDRYDQDFPIEDEFGTNDWRETLEDYVVCGGWSQAGRQVRKREAQAREFLEWALAELQCSEELEEILQIAKHDEAFLLAQKLTSITLSHVNFMANRSKRDELLILQHNKLARAIQAIDNNTSFTTDAGHVFNRMLTSVIADEQSLHKPQKINWLKLVTAWSSAHDAVDEMVKKLIVPAEAQFAKKLRAISPGYSHEPGDYKEERQVAHYMVDWLLQIDYKLILRHEPQQMAATLWRLVYDINPWISSMGCDNETLAKYAGWKSVSSVSSSAQKYRYLLQTGMADPSILYIVREDGYDTFSEFAEAVEE